MSTHEPDNSSRVSEKVDTSKGYESSDVHVSGVAIAMIAFALFAVVSAVTAYFLGKQINMRMSAQDGPPSKWSQPVDVRSLGNMANTPELQNKMAATTKQFPTPQLQTDDGLRDLADLHAREDLLLNNYSWINQEQGKVRIPIERAMELIAQNGLPVAPPVEAAPLLTGASKPEVIVPLTNGFTQTGYEQDEARATKNKQVESQK
jgi:hypothetical protein